jgi:hypothetical protein
MCDTVADEIKQNVAYYESLSAEEKQKLKEEEEKRLIEFRKWVNGEPNEYIKKIEPATKYVWKNKRTK